MSFKVEVDQVFDRDYVIQLPVTAGDWMMRWAFPILHSFIFKMFPLPGKLFRLNFDKCCYFFFLITTSLMFSALWQTQPFYSGLEIVFFLS